MSTPRAVITQTLTQKPQLSQQMRQSVELLQLSGPELQRELEAQLLANPLLCLDEEEGAAGASDAVVTDDSTSPHVAEAGVAHDFREPNYLTWRGTPAESEEIDPYGTISSEESLTEHLMRQLGCLRLTAAERQRCGWIIGNLDDNGFLSDSLQELAQDCERATGVTGDEAAWSTALRLVQSLDPAGVAASGPTQALLIQLSREHADDALGEVSRRLLTQLPSALAKHDYKTAAKALGTTAETISRAHALILSLNPHPASGFSSTRQTSCVIAEVILRRDGPHWKAVLNPAVVTPLHFDEETFALLTKAKLAGQDLADWRERARDAKGFLRALEMRYSTVTAVAQAIAEMQEEFFTFGPKALKPMGLKDVASRLNLSESTVSRASSGKYLQSPCGTFELKYFFSSAVTGEDGEAASAAAARSLIVEAVGNENPAKPLSDAAIVEILAAQGVHVARRTVAKYREIEKIPPKSLRKRSS